MPVSVSVPLPCLTSLPLPEIAEASVVLLALSVVSVPPPSAIAPPVPESAPTVWLLPLRSNVPPVTVSAPPEASEPPAPNCKVPALTVVPPV